MKMKNVALMAMVLIGSTVHAKSEIAKLVYSYSNMATTEFISQDILAKSWQDGDYAHRMDYSGMWQPQGKKPIKFNKDEAGEVISIDVDGQTFNCNKGSSSKFIKSYSTNSNDILYLTATSIVKYRLVSGDVFPEDVWGAKISQSVIKKEVAEFRTYADKVIEEEKALYSENKKEEEAKAAELRKATYGLDDKDVVSIKIINLEIPEKFGHFTDFKFDLVATLKDGTTISTESYTGGFRSDYKISYDNVTWDDRSLIGGKFIPGDKIVVKVSLVKNPAIKTTIDVVLKYNQPISFSYNGTSWSRGAGESALDYKIEVKQDKHAVTGAPVLRIRITTLVGGAFVSEFSMSPEHTLTFNCKGGNGGEDDGQGNNGANGGNIVVVKDPSVKDFTLNYNNNGGRGGRGATASYNGKDGRDGTYKEEIRAVKF